MLLRMVTPPGSSPAERGDGGLDAIEELPREHRDLVDHQHLRSSPGTQSQHAQLTQSVCRELGGVVGGSRWRGSVAASARSRLKSRWRGVFGSKCASLDESLDESLEGGRLQQVRAVGGNRSAHLKLLEVQAAEDLALNTPDVAHFNLGLQLHIWSARRLHLRPQDLYSCMCAPLAPY